MSGFQVCKASEAVLRCAVALAFAAASVVAVAQPAGVNLAGVSDRVTNQLVGPVSQVDAVTWRVDFSRRTLDKAEQTAHAVDSYDAKGNMLTTQTYDADGQPNAKTIYQYHPDGRKRVSTTYQKEGERTLQTLYAYTADGYLARMRFTDADATTISTTEVSTSDEWTQIAELFSDSEQVTTTFYYDSSRRLVRLTRADGHSSSDLRLRYGSAHAPTKASYSTSDGTKRTITYDHSFDERGNWTKRITYVDGRATEITERVISYAE